MIRIIYDCNISTVAKETYVNPLGQLNRYTEKDGMRAENDQEENQAGQVVAKLKWTKVTSDPCIPACYPWGRAQFGERTYQPPHRLT